jgi:hypothetical protein
LPGKIDNRNERQNPASKESRDHTYTFGHTWPVITQNRSRVAPWAEVFSPPYFVKFFPYFVEQGVGFHPAEVGSFLKSELVR